MAFNMFNSIYKAKKVIVTGHTGFKGAWLSSWLRELGADVIGIGLDPFTPNDYFNRCNLSNKVVDIRENILNLNAIQNIFEKYQPDFVFHLAAQPIVRLSYDDPIDTFQTNAMGTMNILEAMRHTSSVKGGVFITTDKVYSNQETIWGYRECDSLGGYDPYSASKACAEIIIDSYRKSFFNPKNLQNQPNLAMIASARAGNVLGGGDWQRDRLIPDCINCLIKNTPITLRSPQSTRPWQHVLDALGGYLLLGEKLLGNDKINFAEAWNLGPFFDGLLTVETVVTKMINLWNSNISINKPQTTENKHEAQLLALDITKAVSKMHWHPILSIDECLKLVIDWYKDAATNPSKDMYDLSISQIRFYAECAQSKNKNWLSYSK